MPERRLRVPGDVASLIQGLHPDLKRKLRAALDAIIVDPSVGKALRDDLAGLRSYRIGRVRLVYRVAGSIIEIVAVGPRASIYEETWRRVRRDLSSR
ncbi:type II toxin-antitoxin system RelE/ParE family toxin [Candidatus Binatia bacterium]|nr:type II toxin-antitoxin system RelE/ParE family toxin [Candidatus Binatia bacterium]